jgi:hypothetical protein
MTMQATAWAMRLKNISPLAKLTAIEITENYDKGDGRDAGRSLQSLADFCNVDVDDIVIAIAELHENCGMGYSIAGETLTVSLPIEAQKRVWTPGQNTSQCHIYVIEARTRTKIGISNNLKTRLDALQSWAPETLRVVWSKAGPRHLIREVEAACHAELAARRITGEWFDVSPDHAIAVVISVMGRYGLK